MARRIFRFLVEFNGFQYSEIVIDPHYEGKHAGSISDDLILELIELYVDDSKSGRIDEKGIYEYFVLHIEHIHKGYRLIFCTNKVFGQIGIINCFRED